MPDADSTREVALDHVAHAVRHWQDVWDRYAFDLGARWMSGGPNRGFAPAQVRFGQGSRLEMLMPWDVEHDDFLVRFLDRSGPGPHHLTFKVRDLRTALDRARSTGFEPVGVNFADPQWMEAFLHPKQASGVVVQLAESPLGETGDDTWMVPPPDAFPTVRREHRSGSGPIRPSSLDWVVHVVADRDLAHALFVDLLDGTVVDGGRDEEVGWTAISWGGPLGVRLLWPCSGDGQSDPRRSDGASTDTTPGSSARLARWLDGRPGRVHHLELQVDDPGGIAVSTPGTDALGALGSTGNEHWEVAAHANHGLLLVLVDRGGPDPGSGAPEVR